jgi:predicted DNA-binding protein with PD1-like motif
MTADTRIEAGRLGRLCVVRLKPNQDLTEGVEAACRDLGLARAVIRAGIGSLNDAHFDSGGRQAGAGDPYTQR